MKIGGAEECNLRTQVGVFLSHFHNDFSYLQLNICLVHCILVTPCLAAATLTSFPCEGRLSSSVFYLFLFFFLSN